jgi:AraC family transcriptional regulator of adaptative response/methylated-DNA-[protein]-cysteine methyltransferase
MDTNRQYELVAQTLRWVAEHRGEQPDLGQAAAAVGISPHHLQRTFQEWAGVSPKQFLKSLTRQCAMERLLSGDSVLDAALSAGLSGPGRLHDLLVSTDALTPGQVRARGTGVSMAYGYGETPFGEALVAWNERGLSFLGFCDEQGRESVFESLRRQWNDATFTESAVEAVDWLDRIFAGSSGQPLRVWLRGSPFQLKVWEALMAIPDGLHITYGGLARAIGKPSAARAVGTAVGSNPLAWIIPCHRVIRQVGELGGYRWGALTKQAIVGYEVAHLPMRPPLAGKQFRAQA